MASTHAHLSKFDPADHVGTVHDAFCEFIDSFKYEYEAIAKEPPKGTTNVNEWTAVNMRRQLLGRFSSRNMQIDFEDEVPEGERTTISFKDTVDKLKARYKP